MENKYLAKFTHDIEAQRYLVEVEAGIFAQLDYRILEHRLNSEHQAHSDTLIITHTEVPAELRGRGCGKILMETVLNDIAQQQQKVRPVCSYAVAYIERNPQWHFLLS